MTNNNIITQPEIKTWFQETPNLFLEPSAKDSVVACAKIEGLKVTNQQEHLMAGDVITSLNSATKQLLAPVKTKLATLNAQRKPCLTIQKTIKDYVEKIVKALKGKQIKFVQEEEARQALDQVNLATEVAFETTPEVSAPLDIPKAGLRTYMTHKIVYGNKVDELVPSLKGTVWEFQNLVKIDESLIIALFTQYKKEEINKLLAFTKHLKDKLDITIEEIKEVR